MHGKISRIGDGHEKHCFPTTFKSERVHIPDVSQASAGAFYEPDIRYLQGPLKVEWSPDLAKDNFC